VGALSTRVLFGTPLAQLKHYDLRPEVRVLHEFIAVNRDEIISRCRAKVSARSTTAPTEGRIDHGVPVFLDHLRDALRLGQITSPAISRTAIKHGHDLLRQGFTVSQVVHDYGDVCQAITELAVELNAPISTDDCRTLNRCRLAFSRWGAEANDGRIYARNLPGEGCIFTVDLPRLPGPALEVLQA
jgi:hypothetical protein